MTNSDIKIELFKGGSLTEIASVVATSMLHNPLHLAVFKSDDEKAKQMQTQLFFEVLKQPQCKKVVAKYNGRIVGVMNYYLPGQCQINFLRTVSMLPRLFKILSSRLIPVLKWKSTWASHDPKEAHIHFGPLAVLPEVQGIGIGSKLLYHFCNIADAYKAAAYLETDKESNVLLYQKFGFEVINTTTLHGTKNWFMKRNAR